MRVLQINKFFYLKGGAERYLFNLSELLRDNGHEVAFFSMKHDQNLPSEWSRYFVENIDYEKSHSIKEKIALFVNTLYSREAEKKLIELIDDFRPQIAHLHNFSHQLTPSILYALKKKEVPVVMTLHDFKLVCPSYLVLNHGTFCDRCAGGKFYNCVITRCHKNSYAKSLLAAAESCLHHQLLHSYRKINCYVCPSAFMMRKVQEMGLEGTFVHIPHFVDAERYRPFIKDKKDAGSVVYWGRLSVEKGVRTLLEAVKGLPVKVTMIGDGPLEGEVARAAGGNITLLPRMYGNELFSEVSGHAFSIFPSQCYEAFGFVAIESCALGLPVVASDIGAVPEAVKENENGILFKAGDPGDLRRRIKYLMDSPDEVIRMGRTGIKFVEENFNKAVHYRKLIEVYENVAKSARRDKAG